MNIETKSDLTYEEEPIQILDIKRESRMNRLTKLYKHYEVIMMRRCCLGSERLL
jgi:hypothetical protein